MLISFRTPDFDILNAKTTNNKQTNNKQTMLLTQWVYSTLSPRGQILIILTAARLGAISGEGEGVGRGMEVGEEAKGEQAN